MFSLSNSITEQSHSLEIEVQPKDIACKPGEKAELLIILKTSTTSHTYQWHFKDKPVPDHEDYEGATSDRLSIQNCLSKHTGAYKCVVTDSSGRSVTSREATISISKLHVGIEL